MKTELLLVTMAGVVLSLFIIVIELAALRKRASKIRTKLIQLFQAGQYLRLLIVTLSIATFFLVQPVIVAYLVSQVLNSINPGFSKNVALELRQVFSN